MSKILRERVSRMWENAYLSIRKPKSFQGPGPRPQIACFAHATPLRYVGNFRVFSIFWGPPLDQILDPHLLTVGNNRQNVHSGQEIPVIPSFFSPYDELFMEAKFRADLQRNIRCRIVALFTKILLALCATNS